MSIFKYEPLTDEEYENEILKNDAILKNDDIDDYKMNIEEPNLEIKQPNTIKNEKIPNPSNEIEPEDHKVNSEDQKPFKYKCTLCDFKTQYSWNLKKHEERHTKTKTKYCQRCKVSMPAGEFDMHACPVMEKLKCKFCGLSFTRQNHLQKHEERHERIIPPCPTCGKIFKSQTVLQRHLKKGHDLFKCTQCTYKTKFQSNLKRHIEFTHEKTIENGFQKCSKCHMPLLPDQMESHVCELYSCEICGKQFNSSRALRLHKSNEHVDHEDLKCEKCGKTFDKLLSYRFHIQNAHEKVTCHECGKKVRKDVLNRHLLSHKPKEICKLCNKEVRGLKKHIKDIHTPDRPNLFECQECGKGFYKADRLQKHQMSVHLKLRPYKCRYGCSFAYNDPSNRNAHEKKSHGQLFKPMNEEET